MSLPLFTKEDTYSFSSAGVVVAANKVMMDIFNAVGSGKLVNITKVLSYHRNTAGIVGISATLEIVRTTTVGTGGTVLTADKAVTSQANLPTQITSRAAPTGGAAASGGAMAGGNVMTEEATNYHPGATLYENTGQGPTRRLNLAEGQGIHVVSGPVGAAGTVVIIVEFTLV